MKFARKNDGYFRYFTKQSRSESRTCLEAMCDMPRASVMVTTAGRPSGIIATAMATATMKDSAHVESALRQAR